MKLKLNILKQALLICTKKEIDLLIYIIQFQDENGKVSGVDYKEALANVGISKSTFYDLIYRLEKNGIIKINYQCKDFALWEMFIINNQFKDDKDLKQGYLNVNFEILHSDFFKKLTKGEKKLVINILRMYQNGKLYIKVGFKKLMEWSGNTIQSVKKFVKTLASVFTMDIFKGIIKIECSNAFARREQSEIDIYNEHDIKYTLKINKCSAPEESIKDLMIINKQYGRKMSRETIKSFFLESLNRFNTIEPAYINRLITLFLE